MQSDIQHAGIFTSCLDFRLQKEDIRNMYLNKQAVKMP